MINYNRFRRDIEIFIQIGNNCSIYLFLKIYNISGINYYW